VANAADLRAFVFIQEFADARDADDARHYCNGKDFDGNRLIVEFARRVSPMEGLLDIVLCYGQF
jgi:hypothetical protein